MVRGIERRDIFIDDADRLDFVLRFSSLLEATETECLAWALLSNHMHLLIRVTTSTLSKFMRRLLTGYAVTFNLRHRRSGHLFQNRYKSIVCEEEEYLPELVRYSHRNPLRAGMVASFDELDGYPWCGHSVLMAKNEMKGQASEEVISRFNRSAKSGRRCYRSFMQDGITMGQRDELVGIGICKVERSLDDELKDSRVLGNGAFVEQIIRRTEMDVPVRKVPLKRIIEIIAAVLDVTEEELTSRQRGLRVAEARSIFCHLAHTIGHPGVDIARRLNISGPGVTAAVRRGKMLITNYPKFAAFVK
jgi:REP element-mobilizing transposase RayT